MRARTVRQPGALGRLACSDPNGDKIALTILSKPAHGTIGLANAAGSVLYRPSPGYTGPDSFTYTRERRPRLERHRDGDGSP